MLEVSRSGYYAWTTREESLRSKETTTLAEEIQKIFDKHEKRYGARRVYHELVRRGMRVVIRGPYWTGVVTPTGASARVVTPHPHRRVIS